MRVATKITIDLGKAHSRANHNDLVAPDICNVYILDIGAGSFKLKFVFIPAEIAPLELDQDELQEGLNYGGDNGWDIKRLLIENTAQVGQSVKLIIEKDVV